MNKSIKWKHIKELTKSQVAQFLDRVCDPNVYVKIEHMKYNTSFERVEVRVSWTLGDHDYPISSSDYLFFTSCGVMGTNGLDFTEQWKEFAIQNYFHPIYKNKYMLNFIEELTKESYMNGYKEGYIDAYAKMRKILDTSLIND